MSPTPSSVPSPGAIPQAFGGDCGEMFAADELAGMFGDEVEIDPVQLARQRVGDEASVVSAGGIVCNWQFDAVRLDVIVIPADLKPADFPDSYLEDSCVSGFTECTWRAVSGDWWIWTAEWPTDSFETWSGGAERVQEISGIVGARAPEWDAPVLAIESWETSDCTTLLGTVNAALPGASVGESGWGIAGLEVTVKSAGIVTGCAWSSNAGSISLDVQPNVGLPDVDDLRIVGAEDYPLPNGIPGHLVPIAPEYGTLVANAGDTRVAITGDSVVTDPSGTAAILAAVLGAL